MTTNKDSQLLLSDERIGAMTSNLSGYRRATTYQLGQPLGPDQQDNGKEGEGRGQGAPGRSAIAWRNLRAGYRTTRALPRFRSLARRDRMARRCFVAVMVAWCLALIATAAYQSPQAFALVALCSISAGWLISVLGAMIYGREGNYIHVGTGLVKSLERRGLPAF